MRPTPPKSDGWFWLVIPILLGLAILAIMYATGCVSANDAALIREAKAELKAEIRSEIRSEIIATLKAELEVFAQAYIQPVVAGIATIHNFTSGIKTKAENIQSMITTGRDQYNTNLDWKIWTLLVCMLAFCFLSSNRDAYGPALVKWFGKATVTAAKTATSKMRTRMFIGGIGAMLLLALPGCIYPCFDHEPMQWHSTIPPSWGEE